MVKRIYLAPGYYSLVDDEDAERVARHDWTLRHGGRTLYAQTGSKLIGRHQRALHRYIIGAKPGEIVDHINGDGLDNRRENLRIVTAQENARNRHGHDRKFKHAEGPVEPTPFQDQRDFDPDQPLRQTARQRRLSRLRKAQQRAYDQTGAGKRRKDKGRHRDDPARKAFNPAK